MDSFSQFEQGNESHAWAWVKTVHTFCRLCHLGPGLVSSQLFHAHIQTQSRNIKYSSQLQYKQTLANLSAMCCCDLEEHLHEIASEFYPQGLLNVCRNTNNGCTPEPRPACYATISAPLCSPLCPLSLSSGVVLHPQSGQVIFVGPH